jgi:hypothetical protein
VQGARWLDGLQDGERDIDIDRSNGGISRNESDGCINLCRDFSGRPVIFFSFRDIPSLSLPALQLHSKDLPKFLTTS